MSFVRRRLPALVAALTLAPLGSTLGTAHAAERVFTGIGVTRDGQGYALVSDAGEVYAYGTAQYRGNAVGFTGKIADISVTADGLGYAMVSTAGQVYAYGTVVYRGNPTGFTGSMVDVSVTNGGQGYVAMSSIGQIYAYNVAYRGNPSGFTGSMAGVGVTGDGQGYAAVSSTGQVYAYNVVYRGNGDPGQPTVTSTYQFVLPRSSIASEYWLTKPHHDHPAADIPVGTGTPYYAVVSGSLTQTSATGDCGLGYILAGDDGVQYTYCHGSSRLHASGTRVVAGQLLGYTGSTGSSTGPHLHFQVRFGALRCPQDMLLALYRNAPVPDPKTLPTSGCTY